MIATPDQMGQIGPLGPHAGPPRADAEPEGRHGHVRRHARRARGQGGQDRVPRRQGRQHPRPDRQGLVRASKRSKPTSGLHGPVVRSGRRPRRACTSATSRSRARWGPGSRSTRHPTAGRRAMRAMNRTEKQELVDELNEEDRGRRSALYYTDFTGLNVKGMTELRRRLPEGGRASTWSSRTRWRACGERERLAGTKLRGPDRRRHREGPGRGRQGPGRVRQGVRAAAGGEGRVARGRGRSTPRRSSSWRRCRRGSGCSPSSAPDLQSPLAAFAGALNGLLSMFAGALHRAARAARGAASGVTDRATVRLAVTGRHG